MNRHELLDKLTIQTTRLVPQFRYFGQNVASAPLAEHLQAVVLEPPVLDGQELVTLSASTLVGQLEPAFRIEQWSANEAPTVIYHHGTNENPYDASFKRIFSPGELAQPLNLIVVRAPFNSGLREFVGSIGDIANYAAMLATSVRLIESLIQAARARGAGPIVVSGISLGGFVTNAHHAFYNSADGYAPLLSGPLIGDVFIGSAYSKLVAGEALARPSAIREALDFADAFAEAHHRNLYPLLAQYDQYIRYSVQALAYGDRPITVIEKGHVTGALAYAAMRAHVLHVLSVSDSISAGRQL